MSFHKSSQKIILRLWLVAHKSIATQITVSEMSLFFKNWITLKVDKTDKDLNYFDVEFINQVP